MRKFIGLLICAFIMNSCNLFEGTGVDFQIKNNTNAVLHNVQPKTNKGSKTKIFNRLEPGKSVSGFLKMKKGKGNGGYVLQYEREEEKAEKIINEKFSDGNAMSHKLIFEIEADTVYLDIEHYY